MIVGIGVVLGLIAAGVAIKQGFFDPLWEKWQDPIRIDARELGPTTPGKTRGCGSFAAVVKGDLDPSKDLDYYENDGLLIYENGSLQLDVVSQVEDETIKVAPYLLIKTTDIEPLSKPVDYIQALQGQCGGGYLDQFVATLAPNRDKVFGAPQAPYWRAYSMQAKHRISAKKAQKLAHGVDYFTLRPGEREGYELGFKASPGHVYHFRVGVQYSYRGGEHTIWTDREFVTAGPPLDEVHLWYTNPTAQNPENIREWKGSRKVAELGLFLPRAFWNVRYYRREIKDKIKRENEELQNYQASF